MTIKERITYLLVGIDSDEIDGGWWETSTGANFGKGILEEVESLCSDADKEMAVKERDYQVMYKLNQGLEKDLAELKAQLANSIPVSKVESLIEHWGKREQKQMDAQQFHLAQLHGAKVSALEQLLPTQPEKDKDNVKL